MSDLVRFKAQEALINEKADHMVEVLAKPLLDEGNQWLPATAIEDRAANISKATPNSIYEGLGPSGKMIHAVHAHALENYSRVHGLPDADLLASVCVAIENSIAASKGEAGVDGVAYGSGIFESVPVEMATTTGVLKRDRQIALILPVALTSITSALVSHIPGTFNQSEIFRVDRVAGSTFGDYTKGDVLEPKSFSGQYSEMDQRYEVASGDGIEIGGAGSTTANYFQFDSNTVFSVVMPVKRKRCVVYYEGKLVARDDGAGNIHGNFDNRSGTAVTVTGSVDYDAGTIDPIFSVPPEAADVPTAGLAASRIFIGMDIDIESKPELIPLVNHSMNSKTVFPHESALAGEVTLQAYWDLKREFNLDHRSMLMGTQVNVLAASKDRKVLQDLYFFGSFNTGEVFDIDLPAGAAYPKAQHYESIRELFLKIDARIMNGTQVSGLRGIIAPVDPAVILMSIPAPGFVPAPGYVAKPQPHYAGKLFGRWDLWIDPHRGGDTCLCYGKGNGPGLSAYNVGTCIAPITVRHPQGRDLKYAQTLWSLEYRDQNPFDDAMEYLLELDIKSVP